MPFKLVNWNVKWAPDSRGAREIGRLNEIRRRIKQHAPDVLCLTEAYTKKTWIQEGHTICSQPEYGYPITEGRRKVLLWSKEPWEKIDYVGFDSLPPGRFVSGVTKTSVGEVTVVGVCIPASGMRTEARRGSERKAQWEDHEQYLHGLAEILRRQSAKRLVVMGDFNQRIGQGSHTPRRLRALLQEVFPQHMTIATPALGFQGDRLIDHIAISDDLAVESLGVISKWDGDRELSDGRHHGTVAEVSARNPS